MQGYDDEFLLGFQSLELLCCVNGKVYILKDTNSGKIFKVSKDKYKEYLKIGIEIEKSI
jgi:hypothetical protein